MATKRKTRSREEVKAEFETLREEVLNKTGEPEVERAAREAEEKRNREEAAKLSTKTVAEQVAALQQNLVRAVADMQAPLMALAEERRVLEAANAALKQEEAELHKRDLAATKLQDLVAEHDERKKVLDAEIATVKENWKREQAQYDYDREQERQTERDAFAEEQRIKARDAMIKDEEKQRDWALREKALKEKEEATKKLEAEAALWPNKLEVAVAAARKEGEEVAKKSYGFETAMLKKDYDGKLALEQQKNAALTAQAAALEAQNVALQAKLDAAQRQAHELAQKAFESASGREALAVSQQMASQRENGVPRKS